jgi:hypothetical protein
MEARPGGAALGRISTWPRLRNCTGLMPVVCQHSVFHGSGQTCSVRCMVRTRNPARCSIQGPGASFPMKPSFKELCAIDVGGLGPNSQCFHGRVV